ncbi:hypothetical protein [Planktothricoides sp. SR001]|nr:hypothetical protein [Planktothricoides sp. SR001]
MWRRWYFNHYAPIAPENAQRNPCLAIEATNHNNIAVAREIRTSSASVS